MNSIRRKFFLTAMGAGWSGTALYFALAWNDIGVESAQAPPKMPVSDVSVGQALDPVRLPAEPLAARRGSGKELAARRLVADMEDNLKALNRRTAELRALSAATAEINGDLDRLRAEKQKILTPDVYALAAKDALPVDLDDRLSALNEREQELLEAYKSKFMNQARKLR